ncbi:ABC transporter permease [Propionicicella superfundia]|uniref:ABC transporter permease n=1 Tax=Propionicicella superfundia TaxID=348582 RepID=UPI0003FC492B|nr:ABC transporter permease [Propionicicella superfundia]
MLRASWKSLLGHKLRMLMSAFAIVLGVAFVAGSLLFTDMLSASLNGLLKGTVADVNVGLKGQYDDATMTDLDSARVEVTPAVLERIRDVPGVAAAYGNNVGTTLYPLSKSGQLISSPGAPTITSNYIKAPAAGGQQGLVIKSGHAPGDGEVMLDPTALERGGYKVGDIMAAVDVLTGKPVPFKIVGTATWGSGTTFGATYMFVSDETSKQLFTGGKDAYLTAWVVADRRADVEQVTADVGKVLPSGLEALSADTVTEKTQETLNQGLSFVNTFLLVFAAIALIVATFLIVNTFSIIVAQRGRELALLRAMGASRAQVRVSVLFEAAIIGLGGATAGIGFGWLLATGINGLMAYVGVDLGGALPGLSPTAVIASYAVGLLVTLGAAYVPAARASKVPPIAAMTGEYMTGTQGLGRRTILSVVMIAAGAVAMAGGLFGWFPEALACVGVGALLILLGVAGAGPLLGRPVTWVLGRVYGLAFGSVGRLAELNAARNPRRTAATASALMIGLALVVTMAILGQTSKTSVASIVATGFRGDLTVSSLAAQMAPSVGDRIEKVDGVADLYRTRRAAARVGSDNANILAMDAAAFGRTSEMTMQSGELTDAVDTVVVKDTWATEHGYTTGSTITATIRDKDVPLRVTGIFSAPQNSGVPGMISNLGTLERAGVPEMDTEYVLYVSPGQSVDDVRQRVADAVSDQPLISVNDVASITQQATSAIDQLLAVIYALLALAIIIAVLGIVNTLALSVIERTREIGLLRAIGLTRGQLRRMVTLESVVVALLGAFLGVGMGLVFGVALQRPLADQGLDKLDIPWPLLGLFLVVSVLVGILAAVWPARRAAQLDVLQAIATE